MLDLKLKTMLTEMDEPTAILVANTPVVMSVSEDGSSFAIVPRTGPPKIIVLNLRDGTLTNP